MKYILVLIAFIIASCSKQNDQKHKEIEEVKKSEIVKPIIRSIQTAHQSNEFAKKEIVSFDIKLIFGENERLDARIYSATNSSKVLVEKSNGTQLFFDGNDIWIHPTDSLYDGARFDALTWSYFFMAPYKLNDPGTKHTSPKLLPYENSDSLLTTKMTFADKIGDAPDDWYIVYQNNESELLEAMAYIVTFGGRDQEKAAQNPHAISYANYKEVEGIPFAHEWYFWNWSEEKGLQDQLGSAIITKIQFSNDYSVFEKTEKAGKVGF